MCEDVCVGLLLLVWFLIASAPPSTHCGGNVENMKTTESKRVKLFCFVICESVREKESSISMGEENPY